MRKIQGSADHVIGDHKRNHRSFIQREDFPISTDAARKWDERYRRASSPPAGPCRVLAENAHLLPRRGRALDLACGLGGNALFLAERGLETVAWDISAVAIQRLEQYAGSRSLTIETRVRDVVSLPPEPESFDVVVVCRFLDRALARSISAALRAEGLLYFQTFIQNGLPQQGPRNPSYLLAENELLHLFSDLTVCVYREEGRVGDITLGLRNEAMLVAQRRICQCT